jgi:hypothetical protein
MLEKRFGKEYERVRKPGRGNLGARTRQGTTRYDFFFDAVKGGRPKRFAHAWRGKTSDSAEKELRRDYRNRGYEIENVRVVTIPDSIK